MSRRNKILLAVIGLVLVGFIVIQFLPVGRLTWTLQRNPNPPVEVQINWNSAEAERLARIACYDCHSNETIYPWYAQIAPVSWLVTRDVNRGRRAMNFSEDPASEYDMGDFRWHLFNNMPPRVYRVMHPEANLTDDQRQQIYDALAAALPEAEHDGDMDMDMDAG